MLKSSKEDLKRIYSQASAILSKTSTLGLTTVFDRPLSANFSTGARYSNYDPGSSLLTEQIMAIKLRVTPTSNVLKPFTVECSTLVGNNFIFSDRGKASEKWHSRPSNQGYVNLDKEQARQREGGINKKGYTDSTAQNEIPQKTGVKASSFCGISFSIDRDRCKLDQWQRTRQVTLLVNPQYLQFNRLTVVRLIGRVVPCYYHKGLYALSCVQSLPIIILIFMKADTFLIDYIIAMHRYLIECNTHSWGIYL